MDKDRKLIIAGNWKMNKTVAEGLDLVQSLKRELANIKEVDVVVCPPFTALSEISKVILDSNIRLEEVLRAHGVRSYSIFLDAHSSDLFAHVEFESVEQWNAIAKTEVCQRWWRYMREIMPSNPDNSPESWELREVFHLPPGRGNAASSE